MRRNQTMTKFKFLAVVAILSTVIVAPALAQAVIQEPGAYRPSIGKQARNWGAETLAMSARAEARTGESSDLPRANGTVAREVAAPPWSAACITDHGPSEC